MALTLGLILPSPHKRNSSATWASLAFGSRAALVSSSPWYAALGELLTRWIEADLEILGVQPSETADHPLPQEPPDDGSCGPCPVPGMGGVG